MSKVSDLTRMRQISRAAEIREAAKRQGYEIPDRFPRAGEIVHLLFRDMQDIAGEAVLRAVIVTNVDFNGCIYGWMLNDPANPMMVMGRDGRPMPAPPMLDVARIPYDPEAAKANHWHFMRAALHPGDLPPVQVVEGAAPAGGPSAESDDAPEPPTAA